MTHWRSSCSACQSLSSWCRNPARPLHVSTHSWLRSTKESSPSRPYATAWKNRAWRCVSHAIDHPACPRRCIAHHHPGGCHSYSHLPLFSQFASQKRILREQASRDAGVQTIKNRLLAEHRRAQQQGKSVPARESELDALIQQQLLDYKAGRIAGTKAFFISFYQFHLSCCRVSLSLVFCSLTLVCSFVVLRPSLFSIFRLRWRCFCSAPLSRSQHAISVSLVCVSLSLVTCSHCICICLSMSSRVFPTFLSLHLASVLLLFKLVPYLLLLSYPLPHVLHIVHLRVFFLLHSLLSVFLSFHRVNPMAMSALSNSFHNNPTLVLEREARQKDITSRRPGPQPMRSFDEVRVLLHPSGILVHEHYPASVCMAFYSQLDRASPFLNAISWASWTRPIRAPSSPFSSRTCRRRLQRQHNLSQTHRTRAVMVRSGEKRPEHVRASLLVFSF